MAKRFSRKEILRRLNKTIREGKPIVAAGSSAGIIAKCAELGGADLIMVYSSGRERLRGLQTNIVENSNEETLKMFQEIQNVVQDTPIIGGIHATESPGSDLAKMVKKFVDTGFSGIINFPTFGFFDDKNWRKEREAQGIGFSREIELIRLAHDMGVFTMAYVFYPADARVMAQVGVDCMVAHVGGTAGGLVGFDSIAAPMKAAAALVQKIIKATQKVNPDIICLAHGGPIVFPDDTRYIYEHTDAVGFVGASSIERIPIERAVQGAVEEFKGVGLKKKK
jgi:predicted TIM-barrel enzyme